MKGFFMLREGFENPTSLYVIKGSVSTSKLSKFVEKV